MHPPLALPQLLEQWSATVSRDQMSLAQAIEAQYRLVDLAQQVMGSDEVFLEDYGQARGLATVEFGGGGRPAATARVEQVLARYFEAEEAVLVQGAGTGAIRAMLQASVAPASRLLLHDAHPYKTTLPAMRHMGLELTYADLGDRQALEHTLRRQPRGAVYLQHVPQQLGDRHDVGETIELVRSLLGPAVRILVDDNYAAMRCARIGVELGADASAISLFKLLAPDPIGLVVTDAATAAAIRRDLSSAGCQVQGRQAMAALRALVYAPVALAVQREAIDAAAAEINARVDRGDLQFVARAYAAQPGIRCIVLVFDRPVAEPFLEAAWRNGSPSRSVGEEAQYEFLPLFTYLTRTFLTGTPGLEHWAVRINPMRGGPGTVLRILERTLADDGFRRAAASS